MVSEDMFENVDGRTTDTGVIGMLIAHIGAFGSGELKIQALHEYHSNQAYLNGIRVGIFVNVNPGLYIDRTMMAPVSNST